MSNLTQRLGHLFAKLFADRFSAVDPDTMAMRDWADLPIHHPLCDRAPR